MPVSAPIPDDHSALLDRAMRLFRCEGREARWVKLYFIICAVCYFIFIAVTETGPINRYSNDVFLLLDGGWRILNGQVPYRDFYLALGPLEYMITAFGLLFSRGNPQGIAFGNVAFGIVIAAWGWLLTRRRMPIVPALLATSWLVLMATGPTPLGLSSDVLSCAMIYNRHGYALLGLVLIECAFTDELSSFHGGLSSGIALVLLAFLKLNFFAIAVLFLLASLAVQHKEIPHIKGFLAGFAATLAVFTLYLRFALPAFFADMHQVIQARSGSMNFKSILEEFMAESAALIMLAVLTVVTLLLVEHGKFWQRYSVLIVLLGGLVLLSGPLLSRTNNAESGCQMAALWAILLFGQLTAAYSGSGEKIAISAVLVLSLASYFPVFFQDAGCLLQLFSFQSPEHTSIASHVGGEGMAQVKFYELSGGDASHGTLDHLENGQDCAIIVNDGLGLLRGSSSPNESVLALGYDNPFPYLLRRKPALGGSTWLSVGNNFAEGHLLEPRQVFGNAQLIMVPSYPSAHKKSDIALLDAYHTYLAQHYKYVANSRWWSLYRKYR